MRVIIFKYAIVQMTIQFVYSYVLILCPSQTSRQLHIPVSSCFLCKIVSLSIFDDVLKACALPYWLGPGCWVQRCLNARKNCFGNHYSPCTGFLTSASGRGSQTFSHKRCYYISQNVFEAGLEPNLAMDVWLRAYLSNRRINLP